MAAESGHERPVAVQQAAISASCEQAIALRANRQVPSWDFNVLRIFFGCLLSGLGAGWAYAADDQATRPIMIELKDHRFLPSTITVPAGQKIRIELVNRDGTADDFDSDDLHIDRDFKPHERATFFIGPLKPGRYAFKGELHPKTALGEVIAVEATKP